MTEPLRAASPAVVTWKDYADTTTEALHGDLAAQTRHVDAVLMDLRRAHDIGQHNAERMVGDLKDYVNRVFAEHERAVALTQAQAVSDQAARARAIDVALVQVEQRLEGREQAVSQRFVDTQRAVETALVQVGVSQAAQQRAVEVALVQVEQRISAVADLSQERVDSVRREAVAALAASEKAVIKSEVASEKRFENVNEFRAQLADQTATFMPREVAEAKISEMRRSVDVGLGELRAQIVGLQKRQDIAAGAQAGSTKTIGYMVTAVGILLTIIIFAANYFTGAG